MAIPLGFLHGVDLPRFWSKVDIRGPDDCWAWKAGAKKKGYGRFFINGHTVAAHRVAYAITFGDPGVDNDVDHGCRVLDCVNPGHLEAVPPVENERRKIEALKLKKENKCHF